VPDASSDNWELVVENREAVLAALQRGECEGILPAADDFLDQFADFCLEIGLPALLEQLPDPRERRSIPAGFFGNLLLHKALLRIPSLQQTTRVLFRSPAVLRRLGFNWRQRQEGFYTGGAVKPFNEEALADFFAEVSPEQLWEYQLAVLPQLLAACPELLGEGTLVLDSITVTVPAGHRGRAGAQYKACVLSAYGGGQIFPLLCRFAPSTTNDVPLGKELLTAALPRLPSQPWHLLMDRGFLDGAWVGALQAQGVTAVLGVRCDMDLYEDLIGLSRLPGTCWERVAPPKLREGPPPKRYVTGFTQVESWSSCPLPLAGAVVRDEFPDGTRRYQVLVSPAPEMGAPALHTWARKRWQIEEAFMALTRYWNLDELGSCRPSVYLAQVYFTFLAYALLGAFVAREGELSGPPAPALPGRELVIYAGPYYGIFLPSELFQIVFDHLPVWQAHQERLLEALRYCEGPSP
jgi:hypothetical protein